MERFRAISLQYGPTRGLPRLCDFVAGVCRSRGIDCSAADADDHRLAAGARPDRTHAARSRRRRPRRQIFCMSTA